MGVELILQGDYERARPLLGEALATARELDDVSMQASIQATWASWRRSSATALIEQRRALHLSWEVKDAWYVIFALDGLAIALRHSSPERAGRLLGAVEVARESVGMTIPTNIQAIHDRGVAETRAALGGPAFTAAWATGRTLSLEEAVAAELALAEELEGGGAIAAPEP